MSFAAPLWLWGLLLVPVLALLEARAAVRSRKALRSLVGPGEPHALLAQVRAGAARTGMIVRLCALTLLVFGASGPQWGRETVRRQSNGSDLVFAVDVSASMDVRDVAPSRLDEARREALGLLDRVEGSRVGVVAFAGDAVRLCPLTLDHAATRLTLEALGQGSVSTPGTDLGRALHAALQLLPKGRREEQAIVVWTDGEDLEGHATDAIQEIRRAGVRVFAVGVGTAAGDVIPLLDEQGRAVDVKHDESGNVVRSRLDERLLRELGRSTRGGYFGAARAGGELARLAAAMGSLARSSHGVRLVERPVSRFPAFALLAAALLGFEFARPRRNVPSPAGAATRGAGAAIAAACLLCFCVRPAEAQSDWAKADRAFRKGDWARAETLYAARARHNAPPAVLVNLATARARLGRRDVAERDLSHLTPQPGAAGQTAGYNLGTLYGERHDTERALGELRHALERNPDDADARWNYELLMREQEEKKQPQQQAPKSGPQSPSPGKPGNNGQPAQGTPQGSPSGAGGAPAPGAPPPGATPRPGAGGAPGMSREQAEQLLGSLQELERLEKQHARRGTVMTERKGKDW